MTPATDALAARLGHALAARGWRVATAESCTGGLLAGAVTAVAGSSAWFDLGLVTYSNAEKRQCLDVPAALLERHGAVSEPVALAMAAGLLSRTPADVAASITGIAGPGGATPGKPVGMVCFGFAFPGEGGFARTVQFAGDRAAVRSQAVDWALENLIALAGG